MSKKLYDEWFEYISSMNDQQLYKYYTIRFGKDHDYEISCIDDFKSQTKEGQQELLNVIKEVCQRKELQSNPVIELYPEDILGKTAKQLIAEILEEAKENFNIDSCEKCSRIGKDDFKWINHKDFKLGKDEEISPSIHAWFDVLCPKCYKEVSKPKE